MASPLTKHAATLADYLQWLNARSDETDPATQPPVFTWRGNDYTCSFSWTEQKFMDAGGYANTQILVLEVLEPMPIVRGDNIPGPALKELITFLGKSFRVEINKHAYGKNPQITCWDPNRGS